MNIPKVGDLIYVYTSLYGFRGKDDFIGGIATIDSVELRDEFPEDHPSYCWVGIKERPVTMYNWHTLVGRQEELKKEFGDQRAYPDPDDSPDSNHDEGWIFY